MLWRFLFTTPVFWPGEPRVGLGSLTSLRGTFMSEIFFLILKCHMEIWDLPVSRFLPASHEEPALPTIHIVFNFLPSIPGQCSTVMRIIVFFHKIILRIISNIVIIVPET